MTLLFVKIPNLNRSKSAAAGNWKKKVSIDADDIDYQPSVQAFKRLPIVFVHRTYIGICSKQ